MGLLNDSLKRTRAGIAMQRSFHTVLGKITLRLGSSITLRELLALFGGDDNRPKKEDEERASRRRKSATG